MCADYSHTCVVITYRLHAMLIISLRLIQRAWVYPVAWLMLLQMLTSFLKVRVESPSPTVHAQAAFSEL